MNLQVGVKALLKNKEGAYLLMRRSEAFHNETEPHWDIPGGRIDPSETLEAALRREITEETGLTVEDDFTLLAAQDIFVESKDLHVVRLTYLAYKSGEPKMSSEHQELTWATKDQALSLNLDPYLRAVLEASADL